MQSSTTFKTLSRSGIQLAVLAAVAAVGVGFGRWVVPEASGGTATGQVAVLAARQAPALANGQTSLMDRKFAQMDAQDGFRVASPGADLAAVNRAKSIIELKFAQMDSQDGYKVDDPAPDLAAVNGAASIVELKFAQMDAEDAR